MSNDSGLFRTKEQLEEEGWTLEGNVFVRGEEKYLPLYEAKMIHHFDHRWATYINATDTRDVTRDEKQNPNFVAMPRYWVNEILVKNKCTKNSNNSWFAVYRWIARSTDERTFISTVTPASGFGNSCPVVFFEKKDKLSIVKLSTVLSSFIIDYICRQKLGGANMTFGTTYQLPVISPQILSRRFLSNHICCISEEWILSRILEITYTTLDISPFANDCGWSKPPFLWDVDRRFLIRCELDAAFFHFYGIQRDDVDYIMETFPIVKKKDIHAHGTYRTKETILDIYDAMQEAITTETAYQTRLDPPPADPSLCH